MKALLTAALLFSLWNSSCKLDDIHGKKHKLFPGNREHFAARAYYKARRDSTKKMVHSLTLK